MKRYVQREFRFDASESQTLCTDGNALRGNRETSMVPCGDHLPLGRSEKATSRTADMHAVEESDDLVVPSKRANKAGTPAAESVEGRGSTKGKVIQLASSRPQRRKCVRVCLDHIRQVKLLWQLTVTPKVRAV